MELIYQQGDIEDRIYQVRDTQVMLDSDLAEMYQVETKVLNQAIKRNLDRFPESFRFQLTEDEFKAISEQKSEDILRSQIVTSKEKRGGRRYLPYVFTEQGVAMLSAVLRSEVAVKVSIQIMNAFVQLRKQLQTTAIIDNRISKLERRQLETDQKFEQVFKALEQHDLSSKQGVFFKGQLFDAYGFVADLVRSAKSSIILIDNYVDDTVLTILSKRKEKVMATIYTARISKQLQLDLQKHNQQYPEIKVLQLADSHDRFMIIDKQKLYHIGASLKDLGKKWFAFSQMDSFTEEVLKKLR